MRIEVEQLAKIYNGSTVFEDLTCSFTPGKSYVIAGANGSGKSTLLRMLCGLVRPTAGKVTMDIAGKTLNQPHERGRYLGYISPDLNLYDQLSPLENLSFFASLQGIDLSNNHLTDLLAKVQLQEHAALNVAAFSTGMKQRLKLAYALLHRPPILLLDEPATNLDQRGRELVEEIVLEQRVQGIVIMASNEPGEVVKYGQEIVSLDGQPVGAGT